MEKEEAMIYGIGTDIVDVRRIRKVFSTDDKISRIFSVKEQEYCRGSFEKLSGRFAAKEALIKAVSTPLDLSLKEIEILNDAKGKPYFSEELHNNISELLKSSININLSISHEKEYATAFVVLEFINEK